MGRRFHGSFWNPEQGGGIGDGQIEDETRHGDLPLPIGQLSQGIGEHLSVFNSIQVARVGDLTSFTTLARHPRSASHVTDMVPAQIDEDPVGIGRGASWATRQCLAIRTSVD